MRSDNSGRYDGPGPEPTKLWLAQCLRATRLRATRSRAQDAPASQGSLGQGEITQDRQRDSGITLHRRTSLAVFGSLLIAGCHGEPSGAPSGGETRIRNDVPLRILLVGTDADADAIRQAWSMSMEQPLAINTVTPAPDEPLDGLIMSMKDSDLAIFPQQLLGPLAQSETAVPLSEDLLGQFDSDYGKMFPPVREGLGHFGGNTFGVAVGSKVFARLSIDSDAECETWAEYHKWVAELDGRAAEPLAAGWAAASFLNRCASTFSRGWLFNRLSMDSEISGQDYVAALKQLVATAKLYEDPMLTPQQIWHRMQSGTLRGGIGFEVPRILHEGDEESDDEELEIEFDISVFNCPQETDTDRVWFIPQTPLACLSTGCRQTDASKRFIGWLSGGQRASMVWQQTELF